MDELIELYRKKMASTSLGFMRSFEDEVNWDARLVGMRGPRGVGKDDPLPAAHQENVRRRPVQGSLREP